MKPEQVKTELKRAVKKPWPKWMRNSIVLLCKAYFPTVDATLAVGGLESVLRNPDLERLAKLKFPPVEVARFCGHASALLDYFKERVKTFPPEYQKMAEGALESARDMDAHSIIELFVADAPLQKRAVFFREFGFAYANTFTPLGELKGKTDATHIYTRVLIWSVRWFISRPPRTVAELHKWILADTPRPKLSPIEELRRRDREALELRRLQQIFDRLGLKFRPSRVKPSK